MAVTPAGAEVSSAVATNWKKIWKKNLKPLADKRYYTKAQTDAKYQPKAESAASAAARLAGANAATDAKLRRLLHQGGERRQATAAPHVSTA